MVSETIVLVHNIVIISAGLFSIISSSSLTLSLAAHFIEEFGLITMTTSTIEKILLSLSKQSDDKKVILNNR